MAVKAELTPEEQRQLELVQKCFRRASKYGSQRRRSLISRYRAYRGFLEKQADMWQSQLSPPYVFQVIETIYAMMASEPPRTRVLPEDEHSMAGAMALDKAIPQMRRNDRFDAKYAQWVKQALVLGYSPMKDGWESTRATRKRRVYDQATGQMRVVEERVNVMDQAVNDMIDADDFFWDPSVSHLEQSPFAIARWWIPIEQLREDENYKNVEMLKDQPRGGDAREDVMKDKSIRRDRDKLVEVWEYWDSERLICVADDAIVIREQPMPFWHGRLPFSMATPVQDIYSAEGISEVELIKDIQAAIWMFLNQRIDNTRLMSNAIIMIRDTMDDPDKLDFEPGAIWPVSDPGEVMMWTPNMNLITPSLEAENELKSDLLNLTAAVQYLGGASSEMMQNNTATGVSILSNAAQGRVIAKRQNIYTALSDMGDRTIANIQQFMRAPISIRLPGMTQDQPYRFEQIHAQDILCNACYEVEDATESMNRQERRDEASQLFQILLAAAPVMAQLGQVVNLNRGLEKLLDAYDVKDPETYMSQQPALGAGGQLALPPGAPNGNGAAPGGGGNPGGPPLPGLLPLATPDVAARLTAA